MGSEDSTIHIKKASEVLQSPLEPFLPLPNHILLMESPKDEAEFYAKAYKKSKTSADREKVMNGLLRNAAKWDVITRTINYYEWFEKGTSQTFSGFWQ
jgi:hypothetical protein